MAPLTVEIWSDIACPWCYIGKRRFERALEQFPHRDEVEVVWRSFQLAPDAPAEQPPFQHPANDHVTQLAAEEGLEYNLDRRRAGNSFAAHRLIQRAAEDGVQDAMKERLMHAHFTEGLAVADPETLRKLAAEVGVDGEAALTDERYAEGVREDEDLARRIGIQGVPYFVLGRRFGISGAQPPELMLQALERSWEEARAA